MTKTKAKKAERIAGATVLQPTRLPEVSIPTLEAIARGDFLAPRIALHPDDVAELKRMAEAEQPETELVDRMSIESILPGGVQIIEDPAAPRLPRVRRDPA